MSSKFPLVAESYSRIIRRTDADAHSYFSTELLPNAASSDIDKLLRLYPSDITQGAPFDTGVLNAFTPQFKRVAAILGDVAFLGPRRFFLQQRSGKQNTWSFCMFSWALLYTVLLQADTYIYPVSKRLKTIPVLGSVSTFLSYKAFFAEVAFRPTPQIFSTCTAQETSPTTSYIS